MRRTLLAASVLLGFASASQPARSAAPPSFDPQERDPNVGLFRLPAHRGEAEALAGPEGFGLLSGSNDFGMMLHPVLQADARGELGRLQSDADRSTFLVQFAGLALTTRFYERIRSELLVSFSESKLLLSEAWLDGEITEWLHVKAGKFHSPLSLERSTTSIFFPLVDADVPSALLPSVDTGVELWGRLGSTLGYNLALVNGATAGSVGDRDLDASKDVVARALVSPFAELGPEPLRSLDVGVSASTGKHSGTPANPQLPRLATWANHTYFAYRAGTAIGATVVSTGETSRLVPQASWHAGPISAYVELARTIDEAGFVRFASSAWGAVVCAVLTGERSLPLHYVIPAHNLDIGRGHAGAFELALSAGALDIRNDAALGRFVDPAAAMRGARTLAGGINWYPNLGVRAMLDVEHTTFVAATGFAPLAPETLVVGRFQVVL